ncbi:aPHC-domain-containing protein [Fragilariopsis cylindrus CCMP1102]|uniref:APHC-domain-containing protein n=1 Tax=Fragilariopsis cylindrus CCMP1102 TaxID=635003 RepID=A0A1E7EYC0_9STRA|nr:aPHC-domain-containing protein [Fragilariopsis cylindrus CCMP1102]|eukprot:OEU10819.1 aPHC-domain-containing protein [Fragilariopsis cylindrus CCMP1102]
MQSADYFINNGDQTVDDGYWEPHTSSIDFCETNYLHSSYIAEPHNLFSSLWGLSLLGLIGIYYGNPTGEIRFKIAYGILILIGIGSAALHGTLNWVFQSADELPMIYLVISALYCLIELGDDDDVTVPIPSPSQQKYNNNNNNNNSNNNNKVLKYPWLPHIFVVLGCTLHVIWHVMAGLGGYTILQFLVTCRMSVLGLPCKIQWILGIIPVVVSTVSSRYKENTKQL